MSSSGDSIPNAQQPIDKSLVDMSILVPRARARAVVFRRLAGGSFCLLQRTRNNEESSPNQCNANKQTDREMRSLDLLTKMAEMHIHMQHALKTEMIHAESFNP